jgi:alpha-L-fucosidase 2
LLPCLPTIFQTGSIRGLRAKGAVTLDLTWENGKLKSAAATPDFDGTYCFVYNGEKKNVTMKAGERVSLEF